jgi:hypothetical protein
MTYIAPSTTPISPALPPLAALVAGTSLTLPGHDIHLLLNSTSGQLTVTWHHAGRGRANKIEFVLEPADFNVNTVAYQVLFMAEGTTGGASRGADPANPLGCEFFQEMSSRALLKTLQGVDAIDDTILCRGLAAGAKFKDVKLINSRLVASGTDLKIVNLESTNSDMRLILDHASLDGCTIHKGSVLSGRLNKKAVDPQRPGRKSTVSANCTIGAYAVDMNLLGVEWQSSQVSLEDQKSDREVRLKGLTYRREQVEPEIRDLGKRLNRVDFGKAREAINISMDGHGLVTALNTHFGALSSHSPSIAAANIRSPELRDLGLLGGQVDGISLQVQGVPPHQKDLYIEVLQPGPGQVGAIANTIPASIWQIDVNTTGAGTTPTPTLEAVDVNRVILLRALDQWRRRELDDITIAPGATTTTPTVATRVPRRRTIRPIPGINWVDDDTGISEIL